MATTSSPRKLSFLVQKEHDEAIRAQAMMTCKLADVACDFFQKLAQVQESHQQQLMHLVRNFRRKTTDLKRDKSTLTGLFAMWEAVLGEVETTAGDSSSLAGSSTAVGSALNELFHRKKSHLKKVFHVREGMTNKLDKADDNVNRCYKDYQDKWTKFTAPEDQSTLKGSQILQCYNSHNDYLFAIQFFNSKCDSFYKTVLPGLLDMVQDLQVEVTQGITKSFKTYINKSISKHQSGEKRLAELNKIVSEVDCTKDIEEFILSTGQKEEFYPTLSVYVTPEQSEKCFDDRLLVKSLTQAPLIHTQEKLIEEELKLKGQIEKGEKECVSLVNLKQSYEANPSYGDSATVENQLLELQMNMKQTKLDLDTLRGKLTLYERVNVSASLSEDDEFSPNIHRRRSRSSLIAGQEHDWVDIQYKFPLPCDYCGQLLKGIAKQGVKCKECKMTIHHKCKKHVPYCSGERQISKGTLARPRMMSDVRGRATSMSTPSLGFLPQSYEVPKWLNDFEGSPPVAPRRTSVPLAIIGGGIDLPRKNVSVESESAYVSDTPPPLPPRTVSKNSDSVGNIYSDRYSPPGWKSRSPPPFRNSSANTKKCVVLYEYFASNDGDLALSPGDMIDLLEEGTNGWWHGKCNGQVGYFPASYTEVLKPSDVIMRVLYDFTAESGGELNLYEGQIVVMKEDRRDGWMFGKCGGEEGLFPSSYVEILKTKNLQ